MSLRYNSLFILQNSEPNISNINAFLVITVSIYIVSRVLKKYNKSHRVFDILASIFLYNQIVMQLMQYSLQFILFSMVNIYSYSLLGNAGEVISYLIALGYMSVYIVLLIWISVSVCRGPITQDLSKKFSRISSLFDLYRSESKWAQLYYAIFIARRIVIGGIIVFINNAFFQVCAMIFLSLASISYMIAVRPFEDPMLNKLETFNEWIILACCYHLLFFSAANADVALQYQAGWSLNFLIVFQLFFNMVIFGVTFSRSTKLLLRKLIAKRRARQKAQIYTQKLIVIQQAEEFQQHGFAYQLDNIGNLPRGPENAEAKNASLITSLNVIESSVKDDVLSEQQEEREYQFGEGTGQFSNFETNQELFLGQFNIEDALPHQVAQLQIRQLRKEYYATMNSQQPN